ncbi:MAG: hypothetical protein ACN4GZ_07795 [Acidimicrobiales bacterium]
MRSVRRHQSIGLPVTIAAALMLSACAGSSAQSTTSPTTAAEPAGEQSTEPTAPTTSAPDSTTTAAEAENSTSAPAEPSAADPVNNFPDATVTDVGSGEPFNLRMLSEPGTPVAMWFYYPH